MRTPRSGLAASLLAIAGLISVGACSNMTGGGESHTSHAAALTQPTVAPEMVRQVQSKLRDDGYYKQGAIDGVWGSGTEAAVRSFQHDHSLNPNGQLDVPTLQALNLAGVAPASNTAAPTEPMRADPNATPADNPAAPPANTTTAPSANTAASPGH